MVSYCRVAATATQVYELMVGVSKKTEKPIKPRKPKKITEKTEP